MSGVEEGGGEPSSGSTPDINLLSQPSGLPSGRFPKVESPQPRIPPSAALFLRRGDGFRQTRRQHIPPVSPLTHSRYSIRKLIGARSKRPLPLCYNCHQWLVCDSWQIFSDTSWRLPPMCHAKRCGRPWTAYLPPIRVREATCLMTRAHFENT